MARQRKKQKPQKQRTVRKEIPPGAKRKALDRELDPGGGPPGSGAGPRHAVGDAGSELETIRPNDSDENEPEPGESSAYGGMAGGAVGGTPAQGRSAGGRIGRGLSPGGVHRGDSTVGTDPRSPAE